MYAAERRRELLRPAGEPGLREGHTATAHAQDRIARAALRVLPAEGSVILDAGAVVARLAAVLPPASTLTVVTHALPVATRLADHPGITLHLVGGRVRHRTRAAVDDWALRAYGAVSADVAVVAAGGFSPGGGLTTPDLAEAAVKHAILAAARRVVLVAGSALFGRRNSARFGDLSQVDLLVTDDGLGADEARAVGLQGVEVVRV